MMGRTYGVVGMACNHCATTISGAVEKVAGVTAVAVDLSGQTLTVFTVSTEADLTAEIRAAVDDAGYELVEVLDQG